MDILIIWYCSDDCSSAVYKAPQYNKDWSAGTRSKKGKKVLHPQGKVLQEAAEGTSTVQPQK